ncbi:hypothetical protein HMPREF9141_1200 [Prevotella multiformis DSM 16608]|uniref:Uncharacterized protein n=1 Tax=Prevotella multiformis DSM 16608 TaxID=888743 RepID=F0F6H8_9BACT|nr:hypothetical protein HMPREF9141_1200 [Prevotella multiformis DSM 16608]
MRKTGCPDRQKRPPYRGCLHTFRRRIFRAAPCQMPGTPYPLHAQQKQLTK